MANYTANAYGAKNSRKDGKSISSAGLRNEKSIMTKGMSCMRFVIAKGSQIMGGEVWVREDTVIAEGGADTFTITVQTG